MTKYHANGGGHEGGHHHDGHHGHSHGHHHGHSHSENQIGRNIGIALALNLTFALIELVGGLWTQSVSILADAFHDFGDSLALALALVLERAAGRKSDVRFSYGYRRLSLASALLTAFFMVGAAMFILAQAIPRLLHPIQPRVGGMAALAILGVAVNGFAAWRMLRGSTMNERVLSWHLVEDVLGWVAVLIISVVMRFTDLPILDPILCIVFTTVIMFGVLRSLRQTIHLFLQGAPAGIDLGLLKAQILDLPGVGGIHDVHIWSLDGESHVLTLHVVVAPSASMAATSEIKERIRAVAAAHGRLHVTIEFESIGTDCPERHCVDDSTGAPR